MHAYGYRFREQGLDFKDQPQAADDSAQAFVLLIRSFADLPLSDLSRTE